MSSRQSWLACGEAGTGVTSVPERGKCFFIYDFLGWGFEFLFLLFDICSKVFSVFMFCSV